MKASERASAARTGVIRVRPTTEDLGEMMGRGMMAAAYCLDAGIRITPQQIADIGAIIGGTHEYLP